MDDLLLGPLGPERGCPVEALSRAALAALAAAALLGGCTPSSGERANGPRDDGLALAGGAGQLTWGLADLPSGADPLRAATPSAKLISRQVHEPLVGLQRPPYDRPGSARALAIKIATTPDHTIWRLRLRSGVRFVDGSPLNATAVLANARRWMSTPTGTRLLPDLAAVDAPTPSEVRFVLERPDRRFAARLGSPLLGIVSPVALEPRSGEQARMVAGAAGTGTGPFQFASVTPDSVELARNAGWWGSPLALGPALDGIAFRRVPAEAARVAMLGRGEIQITQLGLRARRRALRTDALISEIGGGLVAERSVRGVGLGYPSLAGAWLTSVGSGP